MSVGEFLSMGGHGVFIWTCYGLTFTGLIVLAWSSVSRHRRLKQAADALRDCLQEEEAA